MEYIHLISDNELDCLRSLLGCSPYVLYTQVIQVYERLAVARDFSLALDRSRYYVIESDWSDTLLEALDYHMIHVSLQDWPKGIARVQDERGYSDMLGCSSSIQLCSTTAAITSVQVLEHCQSRGSELIHYDQALIFSRESGDRFSLSAHLSIAGGLEFSDNEQVIEALLNKYPERLKVD